MVSQPGMFIPRGILYKKKKIGVLGSDERRYPMFIPKTEE